MGAAGRASSDEFLLDISGFDAVITGSKTLADKMRDLKGQMDGVELTLMSSWAGEGRNTFEKKYRVLAQQFDDLTDDLFQISEDLLKIEEQYIQADTDMAKTEKGRDSRF